MPWEPRKACKSNGEGFQAFGKTQQVGENVLVEGEQTKEKKWRRK